jgi:ferredoxin-NADP reductase
MYRPFPIKRFESTLQSFTDVTPDVREFVFRVPEDMQFKAGQFVTIFFESQFQKHRRQYSIRSAPSQRGTVTLIVKYVEKGPGSEYLWGLKESDVVDMMAPLGVFVVKEEHEEKPLVFLSTGTGVAPFVSIISDLLKNGFTRDITLITGYRHDLLCHDLFLELEKLHENFSYYPTLTKPRDDSYDGRIGRIQPIVQDIIQPNTDAHYYICGLYAMIEETGKILSQDKHIPKSSIHFERYD